MVPQSSVYSFTCSVNVSPACDPACDASRKSAALSSQAHWSDVVRKFDRSIQTHKCNVIVFGCAVVVRVKDHMFNVSGNLIGIEATEFLYPQIHGHLRIFFTEKEFQYIFS